MMAEPSPGKVNRRRFLKGAAIAGTAGVAGVAAGGYWLGSRLRGPRTVGKKVIVIGIDGMDPRLCERMMKEIDPRTKRPKLANLATLRATGGFSPLGTSIPPQSPVAWANFINGAGPGSHGIFDFIHRHPEDPTAPFYAAAETVNGQTILRRQGVPFWEHLDAAGIPTTFYDLPSNYPPSPSHHGHHRCISGMGTPDMLGSYGTYQYFVENGPTKPSGEDGGKRFDISFETTDPAFGAGTAGAAAAAHGMGSFLAPTLLLGRPDYTAKGRILGPQNPARSEPEPLTVEFTVHRDRAANAAVIEIQSHKLLLKAGQWSRWVKLTFELPWYTPNAHGIVRFYLQEVTPNFRLYVSPVNMDPSDGSNAERFSEPKSFVQDMAERLGPFYTTGFQEDYSARKNGVFNDDEYLRQARHVLESRLEQFHYAVDNYDGGLLFFYFSSSDLQSHIFWWDSDAEHPVRSAPEAKKYYGYVHELYVALDRAIGEVMARFGSSATIIVMSDHGFANFGRQFNLNTWLREAKYLGPPDCKSVMEDVDWSKTYAYGLGINGLYVNLKGREPHGIVEPGEEYDALLKQLAGELEGFQDDQNGDQQVIRKAYLADQVYKGNATALAPDLIIGYSRGYRASWDTVLGGITDEVLLDNHNAWSADHCADALEVPGVFFSNRTIRGKSPRLIDVAPSILAEFGLTAPSSMDGGNIF
jgi:predicted AlkP superfamily phosphohydrolase/phosphomutase